MKTLNSVFLILTLTTLLGTTSFQISNAEITEDNPSPKKQLMSGVDVHEIQCKEGYVLMFKVSDGSPACCKSSSVDKLIQREWAVDHDTKHDKMMNSIIKLPEDTINKDESITKAKEVMKEAERSSTDHCIGTIIEPFMDFHGCDFSWHHTVQGTDVSFGNFSKSNLTGSVFKNAIFVQTDLRDADLTDIWLHDADLREADLSGAILKIAVLSGADLSGAILRDADLSGADLSGAILRDADLRGSVLNNTLLHDADLSGADLRGVDLRDIMINRHTLVNGIILESSVNIKHSDVWILSQQR